MRPVARLYEDDLIFVVVIQREAFVQLNREMERRHALLDVRQQRSGSSFLCLRKQFGAAEAKLGIVPTGVKD